MNFPIIIAIVVAALSVTVGQRVSLPSSACSRAAQRNLDASNWAKRVPLVRRGTCLNRPVEAKSVQPLAGFDWHSWRPGNLALVGTASRTVGTPWPMRTEMLAGSIPAWGSSGEGDLRRRVDGRSVHASARGFLQSSFVTVLFRAVRESGLLREDV